MRRSLCQYKPVSDRLWHAIEDSNYLSGQVEQLLVGCSGPEPDRDGTPLLVLRWEVRVWGPHLCLAHPQRSQVLSVLKEEFGPS